MDNIILKKGINYPLTDGKSTAKKRVLPSVAERKRQATFPETDNEVPIRNFFRQNEIKHGNKKANTRKWAVAGKLRTHCEYRTTARLA